MKKALKGTLIFLILFMFNISSAYSQTLVLTSVQSSKWVLSSSKKFEYRGDFSEIRYKKEIYKIPLQIHNLAKSVQKDIQKEFKVIKSKEYKSDSHDYADGIAIDGVKSELTKIAEKYIKSKVSSTIDKIYKETKDIEKKESIKMHRDSTQYTAELEINNKVLNITRDLQYNIADKVAAEAAEKALNMVVERAAATTFKISDQELINEVTNVIMSISSTYVKGEFTKKVTKLIGRITLDVVKSEINHVKTSPAVKSMKPVIYLYPREEQKVSIHIDKRVKLTCVYPRYNESGWKVTASPDGVITDENGRQYYSLYWEGITGVKYDMTSGFVVKGEDTVKFLEEYLEKLGLTQREANEFIIYWLPQMQNNKYNLIHFATDEYINKVPMEVSPKPDSIIRFLMVFKPIDNPITIKPQEIITPERKGFTLVEWGGAEIN